MPYKILAIILIVVAQFISIGTTQTIFADEIIIESNGNNSDNSVNIESNESKSTSQSNESEADNQVDSTSDTGNNSASQNTGSDNIIITGDISSDTNIHNDLSSSNVDIDCCASENELNINISDNGSNSDNQVSVTDNNTINVNINQQAQVENHINNTANTGGNNSNSNNADVLISTGDISSDDSITNIINTTDVTINCCTDTATNIKISGNGSGAQTSTHLNQNNLIEFIKTESAQVTNITNNYFDTGNNLALANLGTINIITGDIISTSSVINDINDNDVIISCDCNKEKPQPPVEPPIEPPVEPPIEPPVPPIPPIPPQPPINPPGYGGGSSSSSSGVGGIVADAGGDILGLTSDMLPATGSYWWLLMTINLVMLLLGSYLRLYSGRSPNFSFV